MAQRLQLERGDLLQLTPISNSGTIKLLPPGKKRTQKLVTGDDSGQVGCYEFKKGEPQTVFVAKPFEGPISCVAIGGAVLKKDKIFASHSQRILGLTKKGKEFFKLTSSLTEPIRNIVVEDTKIWTGCEYVYNLYDNGQDTAFFMSRDQINALAIDHVTRENDFDAILACQDNRLRVVAGSVLACELTTDAPVTSVAVRAADYMRHRKGPTPVVFGMEDGSISAAQIFSDGTSRTLWATLDAPKRSLVRCIQYFDLTKDGNDEIIVGRDDGRLEVYTQDNGIESKTQLSFSRDIGQSILSVECGLVNNPDFNEVVIASYSGKVLSFTAEPVLQRAQDDNYGRSVQTINNENRIKHLKKELDELKKQVDKEKEKLKKTPMGSSTLTTPLQAADFPINSKFVFDKGSAAYVLTIELQNAIDIVILRSPVVLDLVDSEIGTAVVSVTPPHMLQQARDDDTSHKFVAAFRCQSQERRISITLRTTEGEYGDLLVTVVAALSPTKAAKLLKFTLKPLSLHHKVHVLTETDLARPRNRIQFSGNVPLTTLHDWAQSILPEVPPHIPDDATEEKCYYKNAFTGACTLCEYRRDEIIFESESASTIVIVKENITRMANYRRVKLEERLTAEGLSVVSFLGLIRPKLDHQLSLARKNELVDAVQEIAMQETDTSWLAPEYAEILRNQEAIRHDFKKREKALEVLSGIVTDLYVDWYRLNGTDARSGIPALQDVIRNSSGAAFDSLVSVFFKDMAIPSMPATVAMPSKARTVAVR